MMSNTTLRHWGWSLKFGSKLRLFPFGWDEGAQLLVRLPPETYGKGLAISALNAGVLLLHTLSLGLRLLLSVRTESSILTLLNLGLVGSFLLPSILYLMTLFHVQELVVYCNHSLRFLFRIQQKFICESVLERGSQLCWELLLALCRLHTCLGPLVTLILIILKIPETQNLPYLLLLFAYYCWLYSVVAAILMLYLGLVINCIFPLTFTVQEIGLNRRKQSFARSSIRSPATARLIYSSLQLLTSELNSITRLIVVLLKLVVISLCVVQGYVCIRALSGLLRYFFLLHTLLATAIFLVVLHYLALLFHNSNRVVRSWVVRRKRKSFIRLYWRGKRPLKFIVGPLYHIDSSTVIRICAIISVTTGKLLIFF